MRDQVTGVKPSGDGSHSLSNSASVLSKRRCFYYVERSTVEATATDAGLTATSPQVMLVGEMQQQPAQARVHEFMIAASMADLDIVETYVGASSSSSCIRMYSSMSLFTFQKFFYSITVFEQCTERVYGNS